MTIVDMVDMGDMVTPKLSHKQELKKALGIDLYRQIIAIIKEHGPKTTRQRERCGFKTVQKILGIRPQWTLTERIHLAHLWCDIVYDVVGTKDKEEIVDHFIRCFDAVHYPGGFDLQQVLRDSANEPIPDVVRLLENKNMERLVQFIAYQQRQHLKRPVEITVELAGRIYDHEEKTQDQRALKMLGSRKLACLRDNLKLLKLFEDGVPPLNGKRGKGSTYWYLPIAAADLSETTDTNESNASAPDSEDG